MWQGQRGTPTCTIQGLKRVLEDKTYFLCKGVNACDRTMLRKISLGCCKCQKAWHGDVFGFLLGFFIWLVFGGGFFEGFIRRRVIRAKCFIRTQYVDIFEGFCQPG